MKRLPLLPSGRGLAVSALTAAALLASSAPVVAAPTLSGASPAGLSVGAVLHGYDSGWDQGEYTRVAADEFSAVTGTIYMGWNGWLDPGARPDTSGFANVVDWARQRRIRVHGHALVYPLSSAASDWFGSDAIDHEKRLRQYVRAVARARKGKVWAWDIVNEVMADPGDTRRDAWGLRTDWVEYRKIGPDYVDKAFRWAKAADPNALLLINDYGAEEVNEKSDNLLRYVKELRRRGVPIDGVGFQMHWQAHNGEPDYASIRRNMARFAKAGFKLYFTELDVMAKVSETPDEPPSGEELERQKRVFREIARIAAEQPAVESLLMWDFADDRSWLHPTIFDLGQVPKGVYTYPAPWTGGRGDAPMVKKPAFDGLIEGLASRNSRTRLAIRVRAARATRAGKVLGYRVVIENRGPTTARRVRVRTTLGSRLRFRARSSLSNRAFARRGRTITWNLGSIPAGRSKLITLKPGVARGSSGRVVSWFQLRSQNAASLNRRRVTTVR